MILDKILDVDDNFDRTIGHNTPETNSYSSVSCCPPQHRPVT